MESSNQEGSRSVVRLKEVAKRAGYSVATASRVLNGNPKVGPLEKERVLAAAAQLGYVPNSSARALRSSKTRLVGAIIPTLDHAIYAYMIDGLQDRLSRQGVSVIISTSAYDIDTEMAQARLLVSRGVEAVVLVGSHHRAETLAFLAKAGIARVFTYTSRVDGGDIAVGFDNRRAGASAARFLLDLRHRSFAMIAGVTRDNDRAADRRDGFMDELAAAGIERAAVAVVEAPYKIDSGRNAMQSIMGSGRRPTAVFCGSDILAVGAIKFCHSAGIRVPEDVSIVGFDNLEVAELVNPELTTIEVPAREMGALAADTVLARFANADAPHVHELRTRLIVRGSTGPAPGS
jgi:LacI family transcriptional regulator